MTYFRKNEALLLKALGFRGKAAKALHNGAGVSNQRMRPRRVKVAILRNDKEKAAITRIVRRAARSPVFNTNVLVFIAYQLEAIRKLLEKPRKPRKPSEYQRFIGKLMRRGVSITEAAKQWRQFKER